VKSHFIAPLILFAISALFLPSCGSSFNSQLSVLATVAEEESLCLESTNYPTGVAIVGQAKFEKRTIEVTTEEVVTAGPPPTSLIKIKGMSLVDPLPLPLPIRYAEVSVYNSNNQRVQCGVTNSDGDFKALDFSSTLKIPSTPGTYKVRVVSRSYISYNGSSAEYSLLSVKQDKYKNQLHEVSQTISSQGSAAVTVNLLARARQSDSLDAEAGAFNILNSLLVAYDFIKTSTGGTDTTCLSSKLNVYWKAGFNPMQYENPEADPQTLGNTSYYLQASKELFISGGQLGDMSLSNTDHFDDFAIIHEFGHFVEDHCGQWTSPGGNHALVSRIDPRLAWSEGWSNYLAATIIKNKINDLDSSLLGKLATLTENSTSNNGWTYFFNSYGFSDSVQNIGNGDGFFIDLKKAGTDPGAYTFAPYTGQEFDKVQPITYPGEGHTREGAVSRGLFKVSNICTNTCATTPVTFNNIWKSFNTITGIGLEQKTFVSADQFVEKLKSLITNAVWTAVEARNPKSVFENEAMHTVSDGVFGTSPKYWPGYARRLAIGTCDLRIQPRSDSALNNSSSDQRYSNHFFTIDPTLLSGINQISVVFDHNSGSSVDHDVILFKPNYFFNDDYICSNSGSSTCGSYTPYRGSNSDIFVMNREPALTPGTSYTKNITLDGITQNKKYLLNLRAWTAGLSINSSTEYAYTINSNLGVLCPQ
jgi:hypothetical protein